MHDNIWVCIGCVCVCVCVYRSRLLKFILSDSKKKEQRKAGPAATRVDSLLCYHYIKTLTIIIRLRNDRQTPFSYDIFDIISMYGYNRFVDMIEENSTTATS